LRTVVEDVPVRGTVEADTLCHYALPVSRPGAACPTRPRPPGHPMLSDNASGIKQNVPGQSHVRLGRIRVAGILPAIRGRDALDTSWNAHMQLPWQNVEGQRKVSGTSACRPPGRADRAMHNFCVILDFCITYRSREASIIQGWPPAAVAAVGIATAAASYAKQTQTWADWETWGNGASGRPIVQNEANFRPEEAPARDAEQMCKTNPISEGGSSVKRQVLNESCKTNPICRRS